MVYIYSGDGIVRGVPSSVTPTVTVVVSPSTVTPTVTVTPSWDSSNVWDMHVEVSTNSEDFDVKYATVTATGFYPQEISSSEFTGFDVTMTEVPDYVSNLSDGTNDYPIKAKVVADTNSGYDVKMWTGTKAQYDAIVTKDANTLYNITDDNTADAYEAYTKSEVDTLLNGKASTDLANVNDTAKIAMAGASMPSSTYINLATPVNNSQYVAPADGYFTLRVNQLIGTVGMIRLTSSNNILSYCTSTGAEKSTTAGVTIPVRKGVTVTVGLFGTNSGIDMFRFYYAVGSESEAS